MPRIYRVDVGGEVYHVLNRANARVQIFDTDADYQQFEAILEVAIETYNVPLLAYCIMPNHWHLILHPQTDGEMQKFVGWLSNTHTRRWHVAKETIGQGHLYQGRYKSFLCQEDGHFLTLVRYVERNAKKAGLVRRAEDWRWSSAWHREYDDQEQKNLLSQWPIEIPGGYTGWLNKPQTQEEEDALERSIARGSPFGVEHWVE